MIEWDRIFWYKAAENLESAQSEYVNGRYNSCASRCYYACFHAAIHALAQAGIRPGGMWEQWDHDFVQAHFVGQLINRRKVYPASLRGTLATSFALRITADYERDLVTETKAARAVRRTEEFVTAIKNGGSTR